MKHPPKNRRALTLAACCGVHSVQDGLIATLYVLLPILAQTFGLSYAQVGLIRGASTAAMMLLEIPSGFLAERWGERSLMVFGLVCAGLGFIALSSSATFAMVLLSLFVAGVGAAFQHALSSSVITRAFTAVRPGAGAATTPTPGVRAALGTYNSFGDVGKLAFTGVFSLAIGMGAAWQGIVTAFGACALGTAVGLYLLLRHGGAGERRKKETDHTTNALGWGITHRSGFAALALIVLLDISVQGGFLTFLAFLMIEKNVPTSLAAFAVVLTLAGGIFGKLGCGLLADRLGVIRSLVVVQCLTATGIVAVLLAPTLVAYCLLPLVGVVLQGSSSITYGTVADLVHGERRSRAFAAIYAISSASAIIGSIGFGLLGDRIGLAPTMVLMAVIVLATLPLGGFLRPALGRAQPA